MTVSLQGEYKTKMQKNLQANTIKFLKKMKILSNFLKLNFLLFLAFSQAVPIAEIKAKHYSKSNKEKQTWKGKSPAELLNIYT